MVVDEAFGIDQLGAELHHAILKTLRLSDPAQRSHFPPFQILQPDALAREQILEIQRMMHALDDARGWIQSRNAGAQRGGVAIALGDEDRARPEQMGRRLPQRAAGQ